MPARFVIEGVNRSKPAVDSVQASLTKTGVIGQEANEKIAASAKAAAATIQEQARINVTAAVTNRDALASLAAEYGNIARAAVTGSREQVAAINLAKRAHEQLGTVATATGKIQVDAADASAVAAGRARRAWEAVTGAILSSRRAAASSTLAAGVAPGPTGRFRGSAVAEERGIGRGFVSRSTGLGGWIAGPGFIAGAVSAIALKQASDALRSIQEEMSQLQGAVQNSGKSWAVYRGQVEETVKSEEDLGVKESETLRNLTSLIRVTGNVQKARREETLATNISRGAHVEMSRAVDAIVQAENGRFRGLQRLIGPIKVVKTFEDQLKEAHIKVTNANREQVIALQHRAVELDKQKTIQQVLATAETKFAGEAKRHMNTAEGATDARRVAIEKLQVSIGRGLLPVEERFSEILAKLADKLRTSKTLHDQLHAVGVILNAGFVVLSKTFEILGAILDTKVGHAFERLMVIAVSPAAAIIVHWQAVEHFFSGFWKWLLAGFRTVWDVIKLGALETYRGILEPFSHLPGRMGKWARDGKDAVETEIAAVKADMAKQGEIAGDAWGSAFGKNMIKSFEPFLGTLQQQMDSISAGAAGTVPGATVPRVASAGAPPTSFRNRVFGPTPGLSALNKALPGSKGSPAIGFAGHAGKSYHYSGEALDIGDGGNPAQLISDWNFLYPLRDNFAELIWNPPLDVQARAPGSGAGYFWGIPGKFSDHTDHIHVAFTGTTKELKQILGGKASKPTEIPKPPKDTFQTDIQTAKEIGARTGKKKHPKKITGLTLSVDTGKLDAEQQDNARLIYKTAIANGLTPSQALELVAAAYAESKLKTHALNAKSGAFGLFQLLSPEYKKAYEHYLGMGYDPATANTMAIMGSYVKYFKAHPHAAPGEAGAAVEASGEGAGFYRKGIGSLFKLTGGGAMSAVEAAARKQAAAIKKQVADLRKLLTDAIQGPSATITLSDIFGRIGTSREALAALHEPLNAANTALVARLTALRTKLNTLLSKGLISNATIASIKAQMRAVGAALAAGLDEQTIRSQAALDLSMSHIRRDFQRRQQAQLDAFDKDTQAQLDTMRKNFDKQMQAFDRETQAGLQGFVVAETPAEAALRQFQEQRQAEQDAATMAAAIASGDPEQIRQAQLDQQEKFLTAAAQQSRNAQDLATKDQQDAYQQARDDQRQALQDKEDASEQSYQAMRTIARTGLEDMLSDQAAAFETDLDVWQAWLHERASKLDEFYGKIKEKYGVGPGDQGVGGLLGRVEESVMDALLKKAIGGVTGTVGGQPLQHGGTIRAPHMIGRGDMIAARLSHNETVIDSGLTDALREMVQNGRMGGDINVIIPGATLIGKDREVARHLAEATAPEIQRRITYRTTV